MYSRARLCQALSFKIIKKIYSFQQKEEESKLSILQKCNIKLYFNNTITVLEITSPRDITIDFQIIFFFIFAFI